MASRKARVSGRTRRGGGQAVRKFSKRPAEHSIEKQVSSARQLCVGILSLGALSFYLWVTTLETIRRYNEFHRLELTASAIHTAQSLGELRAVQSQSGEELQSRRALKLNSDPNSPCEIQINSGPAGRSVFGHRTIRDPEFLKVDGRHFLLIQFDYLCNYYSWGVAGETGGLPAAILLFRDSETEPWWVAMYEPELQRFEPRLTYARTEIVITQFDRQDLEGTNLDQFAEIIQRLAQHSTVLRYERIEAALRAKVQQLTGRAYSSGEEALGDVLTRGDFNPSFYGVSIEQDLFSRIIPALMIAFSFALWHRTRRLERASVPPEEPWVILQPQGKIEYAGALIWAISLPVAVCGAVFSVLKSPDSETYARLVFAMSGSREVPTSIRGFVLSANEDYWTNLVALVFSWTTPGILLSALALIFVLLSLVRLFRVNQRWKLAEAHLRSNRLA